MLDSILKCTDLDKEQIRVEMRKKEGTKSTLSFKKLNLNIPFALSRYMDKLWISFPISERPLG